MRNSRVSRRDFLKGAAVGTAALASAAALKGSLFSIPEAVAARPGPSARNPLYIPPTFSPSGYTLTAAPATVSLGGGRTSAAWAYNGLLPGPTLRASRGTGAQINLVNGLPQETITHWHGMIVDTLNDGHPRYAIQPGGTYSYNFAINQRAAMNWYHPHPDMLTGEQVAMGLAGAFIVNDSVEGALGLPSGVYEVPLVIRDAKFDTAWNMLYKPRSGGFLGDTPLVNGTLNPKLDVDTALYRFRVLNGSNSRIFGLALGNNEPFTLIGNDGGLIETSVPVTSVDMANGERVDLLIDFRQMAVGSSVLLRDLRSGWDFLQFVVARKVNDTSTIPTSLSTITRLSNPVRTRNFSFDGMSKINGKEYDINRIDFQVPFGETE